jgi:ankyrin repeat protein
MSSHERFGKAIDDGDSSMVESLISRRVVDVNARLPRRFQPPALVYAAALNGRVEIVDILLRSNARVDDTDKRGQTACHAAARGARHDVLALLLARQPNLAAVDVDGKTAFCRALECIVGDGRCALMLLEAGASLEEADRSYFCLFASKSTAAIQALMDRGVVVRELRDFAHGTALHSAIHDDSSTDVFDMLVNVCSVDLEVHDKNGYACVHVAASRANVVALRWLIDAGANVNVADNDGATPLHWVKDRDCAVLLLAAGANVCAGDSNGRTALHWISDDVRLPAFQSCLAAGADLDAADNTGRTARQELARRRLAIDPATVEAARRDIAKTRADFVRYRALAVCIGLQSLELDALQMCEILHFACGPVAPLIPFHIWWKIATTIKHYRTK